MDEVQNQEEVIAPNEEVEEQSTDQPEEVEQEQTPQEPEQEDQPAEEEQKEEEPSEERPPSRREELRIQQLLQKMKQQDAPRPEPQQKQLDYTQELAADDETVKLLERDRELYGKTQYNAGLEQAKSIQFHTRLEIDAPKIEEKHRILNKEDKENFNPVVADAINSWYLSAVGYDPQSGIVQNSDIRYADFVEGLFELADEIASNKVAKTSKNIVKQAANTALRPDGSSPDRLNLNKAPQDMTDKELDAYLKAQGLS